MRLIPMPSDKMIQGPASFWSPDVCPCHPAPCARGSGPRDRLAGTARRGCRSLGSSVPAVGDPPPGPSLHRRATPPSRAQERLATGRNPRRHHPYGMPHLRHRARGAAAEVSPSCRTMCATTQATGKAFWRSTRLGFVCAPDQFHLALGPPCRPARCTRLMAGRGMSRWPCGLGIDVQTHAVHLVQFHVSRMLHCRANPPLGRRLDSCLSRIRLIPGAFLGSVR